MSEYFLQMPETGLLFAELQQKLFSIGIQWQTGDKEVLQYPNGDFVIRVHTVGRDGYSFPNFCLYCGTLKGLGVPIHTLEEVSTFEFKASDPYMEYAGKRYVKKDFDAILKSLEVK